MQETQNTKKPEILKRRLMMAIDEITPELSAKNTLGMLAGKHGKESFFFSSDGVPTLSLESSPASRIIEEGLHKGDTAMFDAGSKAFMKILENYADKNGCIVRIGDRVIYDATEAGADFGKTFVRVKEAVRNGETLELSVNGQRIMNVRLGVSEATVLKVFDVETEFMLANASERIGVVRKAMETAGRELRGVEAELRTASGVDRTKLLHRHIHVQAEMRQLKDLEIAADILQDTTTMKNIRSLENMRESLVSGKFAQANEGLTEIQKAIAPDLLREVTVHLKSAATDAERTQVFEAIIQSMYDGLFKKYDVDVARTDRVRQIVGAAAATGNIWYATTGYQLGMTAGVMASDGL